MSQLVTLKIDGMTCASCVARVEKALLKVPGVDAASVNLATEKAQIRTSDVSLVGDIQKTLIEAIEKSGYEATLADHLHQTQTRKKIIDLYGTNAQVIAILLSAPLVLPMLLMAWGIHVMLPALVQFLLATPVQFILGSRFYVAGYKGLLSGSGNMDLLVAIGTSAAYGLSIYQWQQSGWGNPHELYFESAAVVITLVMLGKWLEKRAKKETTEAITALQTLWPEKAKLISSKTIEPNMAYLEVPVGQIIPGDWVVVLPGERIPVDGVVLEGSSELDESMLTGETKLILKTVHSKVTGGSMNGAGRLLIQAEGVGEESTLAKMIRLVEDAQAEKAPIQRLVDQVSSWFVPAVVLIAAANFLFSFFYLGHLEEAILHSVAILVIACPCALGLATPAAIMAGTGAAAKYGILIKDAQALELAHRVNVVAFDKTGTLTIGHPRVMGMRPLEPHQESEIIALAHGLQMGSEHPLAKAIVDFSVDKKIEPALFSEIKALVGRGVSGLSSLSHDEFSLVSHHGLLADADESEKIIFNQIAQQYLNDGLSVSWLKNVTKQEVLGLFAFGDELKPGVASAVARLKSMGVRTVMISGDNRTVANLVAHKVGIDQVFAEVLPTDKAKIIQSLKKESTAHYVAMVGDGINDAPALAAADVGIAMATGTDVAMHAAGITLMRGDPGLVPDAIDISRATWRKIRQNLFWAFFYNLIGIPLAAVGYLSPVIAGLAMAASSVSVITNALLLKRWSKSSERYFA